MINYYVARNISRRILWGKYKPVRNFENWMIFDLFAFSMITFLFSLIVTGGL